MSSPFVTVAEALRAHAQARPHERAIDFLVDGERQLISWSYGELHRRAREIGAALRRMNLSGQTVLLVHPPGLEFVAALYGCFSAGAIAVPTFPPRFRLQSRNDVRFGQLVEDVKPRALLTTEANLAKAKWWSGRVMGSRDSNWVATDASDLRDCGGEEDAASAVEPESIAMLQYTSGSTRSPRGVVLTHRNLVQNERLITAQFRHDSSSHMVSWLPPYHDMGLMGGILQPLTAGFPLTLMEPLHVLQRPLRWLQAISWTKATTSGAPNSIFELCVRTIRPEAREGLDLSSWTAAFNGSEPVRAETVDRFARCFASCGFSPHAFLPCYGLAESTLLVAGRARAEPPRIESFERGALQGHKARSDPEGVRVVSCGEPGPGYELAIVDAETSRECQEDEIGEIWISGSSVARGYWNRPDDTRDAFENALPGRPGRFLRTGDLGIVRDGDLFVTGRIKDLVIVRGKNFYPQDIETCAGASHPALTIGASVAFSVDAPEGEAVVVVCEVRREARHHADVGEIIRAVRQQIGDELALGVADVLIVPPAALLRTANGKIRRSACRQAYLERALVRLADSGGPVPTTATDMSLLDRIRRVIATVLRLSEHWIETEKPLASLGVDSLMRLEVLLRLEAELGVPLDPGLLTEDVTLTDLAAGVERILFERLKRADAPVEVRMPVGQLVPLSPIQAEFLGECDIPDQYAIVLQLRTPPGADRQALEESFQSLDRRHDAFWLRFRRSRGQWIQEYGESGTGIAFRTLDAVGVAREEWPKMAERVNTEVVGGFNLKEGPLVRAVWLDRGGLESGVLFLAVHHLIADGISMGQLVIELERAYRRGAVASPDMTFAEWTRLLDARAQSPHIQRDLSYWQRVCREESSFPASRSCGASGPGPVVELDASESRRLLERFPTSREQHDFFLASAATAWAEVTGLDSLLVRLESHGRFPMLGQAPTRTIGRYTCQFPFRIEVPSGRGRDSMLERVGSLMQDLPHHGVSYGLLKHLCRDRDVSRAMRALPTPTVSMVYRGRMDDGFRGSEFPVLGWHLFDGARRNPASEPAVALCAGVERRTFWYRVVAKAGAFDADFTVRLTAAIRTQLIDDERVTLS